LKHDQLLQHAKIIMSTIPLDVLFTGFKFFKEDEGIADITYTVLSKLLNLQDISILKDDKINGYLVAGSKHPSPQARKLVVEQIGRLAQSDPSYLFESKHELVEVLALAFQDEDLQVVKQAQNIVLNLTTSEQGLKYLLSNNQKSFMSSVKTFMNKDSYKLRVFEVFVKASGASDLAFKYCEQSGVLDDFLKELNTNNLLTLLNVLEIVKGFSQSKHGLEFLHKRQAFSKIIDILVNNPQDQVLNSFILHFIADLAANGDTAISVLHPETVFKTLFDSLSVKDFKAQETAIMVISSLITNTKAGLQFLFQNPARMNQFLSTLTTNDVNLIVTVLHSFGQIFESKVHTSAELQAFYQQIEQSLQPSGKTLIPRLMATLKDPFVDHRYAVFHLMRGLCRHIFGIQALLAYPTFFDFLLDRNTETTKEGLYFRFMLTSCR
jgi:26S proteasome non-ATPase regulatory subunit 5